MMLQLIKIGKKSKITCRNVENRLNKFFFFVYNVIEIIRYEIYFF